MELDELIEEICTVADRVADTISVVADEIGLIETDSNGTEVSESDKKELIYILATLKSFEKYADDTWSSLFTVLERTTHFYSRRLN